MKRWLVSGTSVKEQVISKGVFPSFSKLGYGLLSRYTGWRKHHQLPSEALKLGAFWQGYGGQTQLPKKGKKGPSFFPPASTKPISGWGSPGQESRWPPTPTLPLIRADTFSDTWVCSARVKWLDACDLPARCRVSRWAGSHASGEQLASKTSEMLFLCQPVSSAAIGKWVRGGRQSRDVSTLHPSLGF